MTPLADSQYVRTLAETLDALPEQVVRYRLPDLTIVYCNVAWATWYHLEPSEVLGTTANWIHSHAPRYRSGYAN